VEQDFYPTPSKVVDLILQELDPDPEISFGEPCRGNRVIYDRVPYFNKQWAELSDGVDFLKTPMHVDLQVTNPPFSLAEEFLEKSLKEADTVVYLLRLNFLGSQKRYEFWQRHQPTHLFVLSERPSFVDVCKGKKEGGMRKSLNTLPTMALPSRSQKGCGKTYPSGTGGVCECGGKIGPGTDATEYCWFGWCRGDIIKRPPGIYVI
jgi:hypothetical protein